MSDPPGTVRVAFVMPSDPERMRIGGINAFLRTFVKYAPSDFEIGFVGVSADRPIGRWSAIELEGRSIRFLPVVRWETGRRSRIPLALRFAVALLRHRRRLGLEGSVVSVHRPGTELPLARADLPMWRVVHLSVDDLSTGGSESRWRRLPAILRRLERRTFRRMARVYVVNERAADAYRRAFPEVADRIRFLPNWADGAVFHPRPPDERARLRAELLGEVGWERAAPLVLFAGRLEGQKDPDLARRAVLALADRSPDARLLVVGEGSQRPRLEAAIRSAGAEATVRLLPTVSRGRLSELMAAADCLLLTSAFETGPTVGLEALACGTPVVTTDVGEVAGLVRASGAGEVVSTRDPRAIAETLDRVAGRIDEDLRRRCREAVEPRLAERVLDDVYAFNRELAAAGRSSERALLRSPR